MITRKKTYVVRAVSIAVIAGLVYLAALQFGLHNQGQEFGTFAPYNRVLRIVGEMEDYNVVSSRLSRRLDWRNLGYLDSFHITVGDSTGSTRTVEFLRGTSDITERDPALLQHTIRNQFHVADSGGHRLPIGQTTEAPGR